MQQSAFWDDLAEDLKNPVFLGAYLREQIRLSNVATRHRLYQRLADNMLEIAERGRNR